MSIAKILKNAKQTIYIIDDSIDGDTFEYLRRLKLNASVKIFSRKHFSGNLHNMRRWSSFRKGFKYIETNDFSDHYIIIDEKFLYILSRPLSKIDQRGFYLVRIIDYFAVEALVERVKKCEEKENYCRRIRSFVTG